MKKLTIITVLIILIAILGSCADKDASVSEKNTISNNELTGETTVLSLKSSEDGKVLIEFNPTNSERLPRIADIYLKYDKNVLKLKSYDKGDALKDADKNVFVKEDTAKGIIRITSLNAANVNKIGEGNLITLEFDKISDDETTVEFDKEKQVFAPAEANEQVTFGKGITL